MDIIVGIVTVTISVIAIIVSVHVANKQNKIAVFEQRMKVYQCLHDLILVGQSIRAYQMDKCTITTVQDAYYRMCLTLLARYHKSDDINKFLVLKEMSISIYSTIDYADFLFSKNISEDAVKVAQEFSDIVGLYFDESKVDKQNAETLIYHFSSVCIEFDQKHMKAIKSKLKI